MDNSLAGRVCDFEITRRLCQFDLGFSDVSPRPAERIKDKHRDASALRMDAALQFMQRTVRDLSADALDLGILAVGVTINSRDAGAGSDIMELVKQDLTPCLVEFRMRIARAEKRAD